MTANRISAGSNWLGHTETRNDTKRLGDTARKIFSAIATGRAAAHDYQALASHGVAPQEATETVFKKHFSKR
ncbi:MAG TPA: hypothetical protein VH858_06940 [Hyphomicrobiales bacterium]|jgi:hypothetical protein